MIQLNQLNQEHRYNCLKGILHNLVAAQQNKPPGKRRQDMGAKKVKHNKNCVNQLPNDKPVLYRIETEAGKLNYAGVAKRGRVKDRIKEHLREIPGASVRVEQFSSIRDALTKESRVIKRNQPKYNEQGK